MFSGIIVGLGTVVDYHKTTRRLDLRCELFHKRPPQLGASIAVDGVCLTVVASLEDRVSFELGEETRALTLLGYLKAGDQVNLEFSLRVGDEISGHFVQGHVDGLLSLCERSTINDNLILTFQFPPNLRPLLVKKGSVCINGVSLTINDIEDTTFSVCLLPYTTALTNLAFLELGDRAHIEVDILGRYVANFMPSKGSNYDCTAA